MGREVMRAVTAAPDLELAGACDARAEKSAKFSPAENAPPVPLNDNLARLLADTRPDVLVDFSLAAAVPQTVEIAARAGVSLVIGTTGLSAQTLARVNDLTREYHIGAVIAPNFALGAVVMMELSRIAARYFDWAEIIELHHEYKADAPSGTAIATARTMAASRDKPFRSLDSDAGHPSRGQKFDGVTVHSVRMPGLVANQEVILGAPGQTLSIKHDTTSRECFMPGVLLAIREIAGRPGEFIFGLEKLLDF
jgi:4-hydroxy-tetrahydrodipicolinate reductase